MKHSEETKSKMSASHEKRKMDGKQKSKWKATDEQKKRMVEVWEKRKNSGYIKPKPSDENRKNMSNAAIKRNAEQGSPVFGKKLPNALSKYFGVSVNTVKNGKNFYMARIKVNGKRIYIKGSTDELVVAKAYDKYVILNNLPNPLNFSEGYKK